MALITHIQRSAKKIRVLKKTTMEVSWDERLFSIRTKAAGAETEENPPKTGSPSQGEGPPI